MKWIQQVPVFRGSMFEGCWKYIYVYTHMFKSFKGDVFSSEKVGMLFQGWREQHDLGCHKLGFSQTSWHAFLVAVVLFFCFLEGRIMSPGVQFKEFLLPSRFILAVARGDTLCALSDGTFDQVASSRSSIVKFSPSFSKAKAPFSRGNPIMMFR